MWTTFEIPFRGGVATNRANRRGRGGPTKVASRHTSDGPESFPQAGPAAGGPMSCRGTGAPSSVEARASRVGWAAPHRAEPEGSPPAGATVVKETIDEADLPAQQPSPRHAPRFPPPHGRPVRSQGAAVPPPQGPSAPQCVIESLSRRRDFERLRREGIRVHSGPMSMIALVRPDGSTQLAVALPRSVGNAVVRNRLRRRLRAVFRHLVDSDVVPRGMYLVAFKPGSGDLTSSEMSRSLGSLLARAGS